MLKMKLQYLGHLMQRADFLGKTNAGKDWRQEEKGTTEDETVGWHHWLNGHESEQTQGDSEGQGSLTCCSPRGCKESNMRVTEQQHNPLWLCSYKKRTFRHRYTQREGDVKHRQLIPFMAKETPEVDRSWGRTRNNSHPQKRSWPQWQLHLRLLASRMRDNKLLF